MSGVTVTSGDRVLWPSVAFTKGDMVAYYDQVALTLIPHISGRALTLGRFPGGVDAPGFAQTECRGRPEWMTARPVPLRDGRIRHYCIVDNDRALRWVANQSAIELHPFLWRGENDEVPTHVTFDLDPGPSAGILDCARVALRLREMLAELGLESFIKTSGSLGLHIQVPLNVPHTFTQTKAFARAIAGQLANEDPATVTDRSARSVRTGRVHIDWLGNDPSRSTIAPYSLRAMDFPTVSTPLLWDEVATAREPRDLWFLAGDVLRRIEAIGDPLAPALAKRQQLPNRDARAS